MTAQPSRYRLALALLVDGTLAVLALLLALSIFSPAQGLLDAWLASALTLGALWVLLSVGLYRDRASYLGNGSRRRRLLGCLLICLYSFLVNEVAGAPLSAGFLLMFSSIQYATVLASRLLARSLLS